RFCVFGHVVEQKPKNDVGIKACHAHFFDISLAAISFSSRALRPFSFAGIFVFFRIFSRCFSNSSIEVPASISTCLFLLMDSRTFCPVFRPSAFRSGAAMVIVPLLVMVDSYVMYYIIENVLRFVNFFHDRDMLKAPIRMA